ncbi:antitoxin family protein [bacterium]|nr:antitoxin family protein [bacterium]MBU1599556.1 antitoxin family protein [bacterium]
MISPITAIYENGVFRPLENVCLPNHREIKLIIVEKETNLIATQKQAISEIAGIGSSGLSDVSRNHDKYLYRKE